MDVLRRLSPGSLAGSPRQGVTSLRRSNRKPKPINCASRDVGSLPPKQQPRKCAARNDGGSRRDAADVVDKGSNSSDSEEDAENSTEDESDDEFDDASPAKRAKSRGYADAR